VLVTLDHARTHGLPILKPGDLAYWEADQGGEFVPVKLLGHGDYDAIGGLREGLTVLLTADRDTRTYGTVSRGESRVVPSGRVVPRSLVKRHRKGGYEFADGAWSVNTMCEVHGVIHSAPQPRLCKLTPAEQAVTDEVTEAVRQDRPISHGAAREIAAWVAPDHEFTRTGAITLPVIDAELAELVGGPVENPSLGLNLLGPFVFVEVEIERAPWKRAALEALERYLFGSVPREGFARWSQFPVDAPNGDARYTVTGEGTGDPERGWVARFCGDYLGSFTSEAEARLCLFRAYYARMWPELYPNVIGADVWPL